MLNLFYDGPGQLSTDFLYRDAVPGRPELNQINTPLRMANSAIATAGTACGTQPALAVDSVTRSALVCGADGLWSNASTWKDSVASHAILNTMAGKPGDVRIALDTKRAYVYTALNDGSWGPVTNTSWVPLALDENGDMWVPNRLRVIDNASVGGGFWVYGTAQIEQSLGVDGHLWVADYIETNTDIQVANDINVSHRLTSNSLYPTGRANPGDSCTLPGSIVLSNTETLPLICIPTGSGPQRRFANGKLTPV